MESTSGRYSGHDLWVSEFGDSSSTAPPGSLFPAFDGNSSKQGRHFLALSEAALQITDLLKSTMFPQDTLFSVDGLEPARGMRRLKYPMEIWKTFACCCELQSKS